jgi:Protein of unknown function (DUF3626)
MDSSLRVHLQFHPDRTLGGRPLLEALRRDGVYKSQFETGTSNGGLTATPGGERFRWESRIFGGAYDNAPASARPKYGALDFRKHETPSRGAAPRFGSSYVRLRETVHARTTFCYPDSVFEPEDFGVAAKMALIELATQSLATLSGSQDILDHYIEAHVHGEISLERDVEALVLDPCFRGTKVEDAAHLLPCTIEWHPGFVLPVATLAAHPEYRGQAYVDAGIALAKRGVLTAREIGEAAASEQHDPQVLKRIWHHVARFG